MAISCPPSRYPHIQLPFLQNTGENITKAWPSQGEKYTICTQAHVTGFNGVTRVFYCNSDLFIPEGGPHT